MILLYDLFRKNIQITRIVSLFVNKSINFFTLITVFYFKFY